MTVFGSGFSCLVGFFRLISPFGTLNRSSGQSLNPRSFAVEKKNPYKLGQQHNEGSLLKGAQSWLWEKSLSRQCLKPMACLHHHPSACAHTWCVFSMWFFRKSWTDTKLLSMPPKPTISCFVKYIMFLSDAKTIDHFISRKDLPS